MNPIYSAIPTNNRRLSRFDRLLSGVDLALRAITGVATSERPYPARDLPESLSDDNERRRVVALMRVNHSGEVAAQALYQGQAFVARDEATRRSLLEAGQEEGDHLGWCAARLEELGGRVSLLNPVWYAGSFAIGAFAGLAGDRNSLGFVAETERQVVDHLRSHLDQLPQGDTRSRAILEQMSRDEARHGHNAMQAGGAVLPLIVKMTMKVSAAVMTRTAYWV